jgi:hypothetical protein
MTVKKRSGFSEQSEGLFFVHILLKLRQSDTDIRRGEKIGKSFMVKKILAKTVDSFACFLFHKGESGARANKTNLRNHSGLLTRKENADK